MKPDRSNGFGQGGPNWSAQPNGSVAGPFDEINRALAMAPRPRNVRLSRSGKTVAAILCAALFGGLSAYVTALISTRRALGADPTHPAQFPQVALGMSLMVVFAIVMLNVVARQKQLLTEGEMAVARVTKCWKGRYGPAIQYEFTTPLGDRFSTGANDSTRQLSVGMQVPVFYDPQKPKKQVALCAAFYELVLPGGL